MTHPKKIETVHAETLEGELCIYDWQRMEVHNLNPTAATVWQLCDGQTTPQQMAAQLHGDLTPAQAEELVWLSLKRLEKANLLENEVVKPAGRKVYTRREMLVRLGVAAALLPVVSSIVAPGPVEAQSPQPITQIVLYDAGGTYDGNLGGRAGADAICAASPNRPAGYTNFRAFISVDTNDEIRDMPANYNIPTNLPIVGQNGTQLAPNWASLLGGDIDATLTAAGSGGATNEWWSGSHSDGSISLGADTCTNWTSNSTLINGTRGRSDVVTGTTPGWIRYLTLSDCDLSFAVKCVAY